ncbi:MAG: MFS transporter [Actinomycetota bacterium]
MLKRGLMLLTKRRDFGLLMAVQFLAQAGDGLVQAALGKFIAFGGQRGFDLEGARSPDELLRISLYLLIPYTVLSPFLGVVIDRWDRRKLLFLANGLRGAVMLIVALVGVDAIGDAGLFLAFLMTVMSTRVVLATKAAALPATLDGSALVEGNAVSQLGGALFQLGGFGVAFIGATFLPVAPLVAAGALVYIGGALVALPIRRAGEARPGRTFVEEILHVARNIVAGLREVARTPQAASSITTYFWLRLLWSYSLVGIAFIARELLAGDDFTVTVLTGGAGAAGAVLGFVMAPQLQRRVETTAHLVLASSALGGIAVTVLGAIPITASIALLALFLGFGFFLAKISLDTMVQEALGDDFRGRAFSLYDIAYNLAWVLAAAVMKLFWTEGSEGALIAGMGVAFLVGLVGIGWWFRRAGLLRAHLEVEGSRL